MSKAAWSLPFHFEVAAALVGAIASAAVCLFLETAHYRLETPTGGNSTGSRRGIVLDRSKSLKSK